MRRVALAILSVLTSCSRYAGAPSPDRDAERMIASVETGAKNAFQMETEAAPGVFVHRFCPTAKAPVPASLPPYGERVTVPASSWEAPAWSCLRASFREPMGFQIHFASNGQDGADAEAVVTAARRLEDGHVRTYTVVLAGSATGDATRVSSKVVDL